MAQPKKTAARPAPKPMAGRELKPWQLATFILVGLLVASIFVFVGFAKKSHTEFGQWPWARTAVPPKMYYDQTKYTEAGTGSTSGLAKVGKTPGGGTIYAASTSTKPAPTTIVVTKPDGSSATKYTIVSPAK